MKTARLNLRAVVDGDTRRIAALAGEWDVASMTGAYPISLFGGRRLSLGERASMRARKCLALNSTASWIGICGFTLEENGDAELGYWIGKPYWGQGYATEAARAVMDYGFAKSGVRRLRLQASDRQRGVGSRHWQARLQIYRGGDRMVRSAPV